MSAWLGDGVVLEGMGSGMPNPPSARSPHLKALVRRSSSSSSGSSSPWMRGGLASPTGQDALPPCHAGGHPENKDKADELFELCDKDGKGFINKRDMQRLHGEVPLSPEQLESVFDSLDRESNGFLTPLEFRTGLGELLGEQETDIIEQIEPAAEEPEQTVDHGELRFTQILSELGADKVFKDQWQLCSLWSQLHRERPDLLNTLDGVLSQTVALVQDSLREKDSLEQALRRREYEHDCELRSLYDEMEVQIRKEKEKRIAQESTKPAADGTAEQLQEELMMREQELEFTLTKQRELENRIANMRAEQAATREQNQHLNELNLQLQEQLDTSKEKLQTALNQLEVLQTTINQQTQGRDRAVMKVSRDMQKEKESLIRQLDMLRDMNKRLRDETDAHDSQKRNPGEMFAKKMSLEEKGSVISNTSQKGQTGSRQVNFITEAANSFVDQLEETEDTRTPASRRMGIADGHSDSGEFQSPPDVPSAVGPQRVFKLVFLGSSGVGKSSFIHYYCKGNFPDSLNSTVGIDFQVRNVQLDSCSISLQLWDTAGQERFNSITQQYYRKADGILAIYDITNALSLASLTDWLDLVQDRVSEGAMLMLLGNKADVAHRHQRQVPKEEGQRVAERYHAAFFECSAKTGHNVMEAMTQLAKLLAEQQDKLCNSGFVLSTGFELQPTTRRRCC